MLVRRAPESRRATTLVAAAIRQMARDLREHERARPADVRRCSTARRPYLTQPPRPLPHGRARSRGPAGSTSRTCSTRSAAAGATPRAPRPAACPAISAAA